MLYNLEVTLVKALDLPAADFGFMGLGGKSDPYVTFKVDKKVEKSTTIASTLNPTWSPPEKFRFAIDRPKEKCLDIKVFDRDRLNADDLIGTAYIALAPFLETKVSEVVAYDLEVPPEFEKQHRKSVLFLEIKLAKSNDRVQKVLEMWENQRYHIVKKWTYDIHVNGSTERRRWSSVDNSKVSSDAFEDVAPTPPSHLQAEGWTLDVSQGDENGWVYAPTFSGPWQKDPFTLAMVRRRKWVNNCTLPDNQEHGHR
uniref:C2 domain-containing protein n=1 Tax=Globisporangium ultimum (strain ATCC 200006 / CBS 805.95 / DAOM BR144) TaxID=431595 RepID=K3WIG3_GLOUD